MDIPKAAQALKALGHPGRLEIFLSIVRAESQDFKACDDCFVSGLMTKLGVGAPTVSHHLKELVNAGLIETQRQGKYLVARPDLAAWQAVKNLLP